MVTLGDQLPAANVTVETYHSFDGFPSVELASTTTDESGRYQLTDLPPAEKGYWVRATADGYGGSTGWFATVDEKKPTKVDLHLLSPPEANTWIDSDQASGSAQWVDVQDPQCFSGARKEIRVPLDEWDQEPLTCEFDVPADGTHVLHIGSGMHAYPHYWSLFEWRIDEGPWQGSMSTLTIEGLRYGDRLSHTFARSRPLHLDAGEHAVQLRPSGTWLGPTGHVVWSFDTLAVEQLPRPEPLDVAGHNAPTLSWRGAGDRDVVLQLSHEPDFSDGTITVPRLEGGTWTVPTEWKLADGDYWWRVKPMPPAASMFTGSFGEPAKLTIDTPTPTVTNVRESVRGDDRATLRWETSDACESWIEYDVSTTNPRYRTEPSGDTRHVAHLTDLDPMTCYRYWIVTRSKGGATRTLRRQFLTERGPIAGRQSPFGVFGQGLPYADQLSDAGVQWMSDYWDWKTLEPTEGQFKWTHADERMKRAEDAGIDLTVTFWGTPDWIRPSHAGEHAWDFTFGPDDLDAAGEFFHRIAKHCKGRVDWFLPWIEPNVARDPVFGFPRGYWASRPHARSYAAYERAAYIGAKRGNPDARVVGMNTAGIDFGFIEKCYDEGAADFFDVMNVHYYAQSQPFEKQNPEGQFERLRALMAQYGDAEKPIYCSEGGGASSGLEGTDEATQAANLVRIYIISIANDIDKLAWTFSHDVKPYGSKKVDMIMWMGIFRHDPDPTHQVPDLSGEPKPAYFAMENMTSLVAGSEYRRRVRLGEAVRAYRFERADQRITVLWSEGESTDVELPINGEVLRVVSHMGDDVPTSVESDSVGVTVSGEPIFVVESR